MSDEPSPSTSSATFLTEINPSKLIIDDMFFENFILDDNAVCSTLSRYGSGLKELILKSNNEQVNEFVTKMAQYCPNVENVNLHLIGIEQIECLKYIASSCPKIQTVVLYICPNRKTANYKHYYDSYIEACSEGMYAIAESCQRLKCLSVTNLPNIHVKWLEVINPNLLTLNLFESEFTPEAMRRLLQRCHNLEEFSLDSWQMLYQGMVLEFLSHYRSTLRVFRKKYRDYFDEEWRQGLPLLNYLEVLQVSAYVLDDEFISALAKNCLSLQFLDVGHSLITDLGLKELQSLPSLKYLVIGERSKINGHGIELLAAKGVLQEVTVGPSNCSLHEVCRHLALKFPKIHFILQEESRCAKPGEKEDEGAIDKTDNDNSEETSETETETESED